MVKYRVTEDQLQKIFESLEMRRISEVDNYPAGSDTPDAPWNQNDMRSKSLSVNGDFKLIAVDSGEYLILNQKNNQLLYTMDEVWDNQDGNDWVDIKDRLRDFIEIPQDEMIDDDGKKYVGDSEDWKGLVSDDEVGKALANYLNFYVTKNDDLGIVDFDSWESGVGEFFIVGRENYSEIYSEVLRSKASEMVS
jgi:hypothetical protein